MFNTRPDDAQRIFAALQISGWRSFFASLAAALERAEFSDKECQCIEALFMQNHPRGTPIAQVVTKEKFTMFLTRYGPPSLLAQKCVNIIEDGLLWFHGDIDTSASTALLASHAPQNEKMFLVRYSSRSPGAFTIAHILRGQLVLRNINNNTSGEGILLPTEGSTMKFSNFVSFLQCNTQFFATPCPAPAIDDFQLRKNAVVKGTHYPWEYQSEAPIRRMSASSDLPQAVAEELSRSKKSLNVSSRNLSTLGSNADAFASAAPDLTEFSAENNKLTELPQNFGRSLSGLCKLSLQHNLLSTLTPCFTKLQNLTELNLSSNKFTRFPEEVTALRALENFYIADNQLTHLPESISKIDELMRIDLSYNQISDLRPIAALRHLRGLNVQDNKITTLPVEMSHMSKLRMFNVKNNLLETITPEVARAFEETLENAHFEGNPLSNIPDWVKERGFTAILGRSVPENQAPRKASKPEISRQISLGAGRLSHSGTHEMKEQSARQSTAREKKAKRQTPMSELPMPRFEDLEKQTINDFILTKGDKKHFKKQRSQFDEIAFIQGQEGVRRPTAPARLRAATNWDAQSQDLIEATSDFRVEVGSSDVQFTEKQPQVDHSTDCREYETHFWGKMHANFCGTKPKMDRFGKVLKGETSLSLSVYKESVISEQGVAVYKALLRTDQEDKIFEIPEHLVKKREKTDKSASSKRLAHSKYLKEAFIKLVKPLLDNASLYAVRQADSHLSFLKLEHRLRLPQAFRFGVLYAKNGQTTEIEMYNNATGSPAYNRFLEFIGTRIRLKGFTKHRAGLDVKSDATGTDSYFTEFEGFEIMFHCSTLLPLLPGDKDRLERKRHIGNDVVVIIFKDTVPDVPSEPLPLHDFRSHMTHIYVVIEVDHRKTTPELTWYKINIAQKQEVSLAEPLLCFPASYPATPAFQRFLLTKLINCERKACHEGADLISANQRKRSALLDDLSEKLPDIKVKRSEIRKGDMYLGVDFSGLDLKESKKNFENAANRYYLDDDFRAD